MKVHRVGGSLMVAIPASAAKRLDIHDGDEVVVVERDAELVIQPKPTLRKMLDSWEPLGRPIDSAEIAEWFAQDRGSH